MLNKRLLIGIILVFCIFINALGLTLFLDNTSNFSTVKSSFFWLGADYNINLLEFSYVLTRDLTFGLISLTAFISLLLIFILKDYNFSLIFLLLFNPFVYSRIMVGQFGVLLGLLLLPFFVHRLQQFLEKNEKANTIKLALITTLIISLQIHYVFILLIIALTFIIATKINIKKIIKPVFLLVILGILLNLFWLQAYFSEQITSQITADHREFFQPKLTDGIPTIAKIIGMWGFWREHAYITSFYTFPLPIWYILTAMLPILAFTGYYAKPNKTNKAFIALWWIGLILATGASHPVTSKIFNFLFDYVPFFNGFRDSHKFVALIVIAYAYLIPQGLNKIVEILEKRFETKTKTIKESF